MPPMTADQQTIENARVLGICYYVWGGLNILGGICGSGLLFLMSQVMGEQMRRSPAREFEMFQFVFLSVWTAILLFSLISGLLNLKVGSLYRQGRTTTLCTVMAALNCLSVPLGTLLGVFSFIIGGRLKELQPDDRSL